MELYERDTFLNRDISYLCNNEIYEYDISRAGINISIFYNLLPDDIKNKALSFGDKKAQAKYLGVYQRDNREYRERLKVAFKDIRKLFFESNTIKDNEILSIKKDAIFTLRPCNNTEFENVKFVNKNLYTSYYYFDRYEFYYGDRVLDIKNIGTYAIERHRDYMVDYLAKVFTLMEKSSKKKKIIDAIVDFRDCYVSGELDVGYYREFNNTARYLTLVPGATTPEYRSEAISKDYIIKTYNFDTYIKPIASILYQ